MNTVDFILITSKGQLTLLVMVLRGKKNKSNLLKSETILLYLSWSSISLQNSCLNYSNQKAKADSNDLKNYLVIYCYQGQF